MIWSVSHLLLWRALALAVVAALLTYLVQRGYLKRTVALGWAVAAVLLFAVLLGIHPSEDGRWWDRRFGDIVVNTFVFVVLTVPSVTALGLALAVALNRSSPIMTGLRTIFFLSYVLSVTVVTLIWQLILSPQQGIIANVLGLVGAEPIRWITSQSLAMPAIVMTTVWWSSGFAMVLFLAGLQEIPAERYEAATLDGAGPWAKFRYITWPGLTRTTTLVIIVQTIMHFQVFGQSHLITRGGPDDATQVLVRYIYQTGFRDSELGYASTLAVFLFAIMMIFSVLQLRLQGDD
jgi:multiple sugar transport system permease protein